MYKVIDELDFSKSPDGLIPVVGMRGGGILFPFASEAVAQGRHKR